MSGDGAGTTTSGRKVPSMPYIMPDGRPLSVFLSDSNLMSRRSERHGGKRRGRKREIRSGWTSGTHNDPPTARVSRELTDAERAELAALEKVGQRRQRRYLNDKLLRDMAPTLTANDMESLFKPVPFGENQVSVFTMVGDPTVAPLWDLFRNVDADKQDRVLIKWEKHIQELKGVKMEKRCSENDVADEIARAARGWSAVGPQGRRALKHASRSKVEALEQRLMEKFYDDYNNSSNSSSTNQETEELVLTMESSFERLVTHSLAAFYSLQSWSKDVGGARQIVVRRRANSPSNNTVNGDKTTKERSRLQCTDILWLLDETGKVDGYSPMWQIQTGLSKLNFATMDCTQGSRHLQ